MLEVPKVSRCCFCVPLRSGIILFSFLIVIISMSSLTYIIITRELQRPYIIDFSGWDLWSYASLFGVLGLEVIINVILLIGGYQKDIKTLRLYNKYSILMVLSGLIPLSIMLYRSLFVECGAGLLALGVQAYVIIIVRSEIIKLEIVEIGLNTMVVTMEEVFDDSDSITVFFN